MQGSFTKDIYIYIILDIGPLWALKIFLDWCPADFSQIALKHVVLQRNTGIFPETENWHCRVFFIDNSWQRLLFQRLLITVTTVEMEPVSSVNTNTQKQIQSLFAVFQQTKKKTFSFIFVQISSTQYNQKALIPMAKTQPTTILWSQVTL